MNNSKIAIDSALSTTEETYDYKPRLRQRETELVAIIESLQHLVSSKYWQIVQTAVFDKELSNLQKQLIDENDPTKMYRLQGEIKRAEKYNLATRLQAYELELMNIRKNLNGN